MFNKNIFRRFFKQTILKKFMFAFFIITSSLVLVNTISAQIEEELEKKQSTLTVILRNAAGDYIPKLNFEIYTQVTDVDGRPKPGKKVGGSSINQYTGMGTVSFTDNNQYYVLKTWDKNANDGSFYFYDELSLYNESVEVTEILSGIKFLFRNTDEELLKNVEFSLYTQRQDADGEPIKESDDLVTRQNTSVEGEKIIYVSSGSRSLDGEASDYYVLEVTKSGSGKFLLYDIEVNDAGTTEVNYVFSDMKLLVRDSNGINFPANTKVEIYLQEEDADGERVVGKKIKDILTNDEGTAVFEYPAGIYVAKILGADKQYQSFWDLEIEDQERREYTLKTGESWDPGAGECEAASTFSLAVRNLSGEYIPGLKYELYEQVTDVNGVKDVGDKKANGVVDGLGKGINVIHPDPRKTYALKIYDKNAKAGDFWFYDEIVFECGKDVDKEIALPGLSIILRNGAGDLLKNYKFSLYTQKYDIDGTPIKEKKDLVASNITTSEKGEVVVYLAPDHVYDQDKKGTYVFTVSGENKVVYNEYDIKIVDGFDYDFEYILSDVAVKVENSLGQALQNTNVLFYEQSRDASGDYILGKRLKSAKTDINGEVSFQYPYGYYAVVLKDLINKDNVFWNASIKNRKRSFKNIKTNTTRVKVKSETGEYLNSANVFIYSMIEDENGFFVKEKSIKSSKLSVTGSLDLMLRPAPYILAVKKGSVEYGTAVYTENEKLQEIILEMTAGSQLVAGQKFVLKKPTGVSEFVEKLKGKILLQVEGRGEAWYVDMKSSQRYYMKDGDTAYEMMRTFGLGVTNVDLEKIPIGLDVRFAEFDYDGDRISDKMEEALGTDMYIADTDNDGYFDGDEIENAYSPTGSGVLPIDKYFSEKQKGKILLQVESRGEAWYVNPDDGKRYYMRDGESAYEIMRFLSLGITDENLEKIEAGVLEGDLSD